MRNHIWPRELPRRRWSVPAAAFQAPESSDGPSPFLSCISGAMTAEKRRSRPNTDLGHGPLVSWGPHEQISRSGALILRKSHLGDALVTHRICPSFTRLHRDLA